MLGATEGLLAWGMMMSVSRGGCVSVGNDDERETTLSKSLPDILLAGYQRTCTLELCEHLRFPITFRQSVFLVFCFHLILCHGIYLDGNPKKDCSIIWNMRLLLLLKCY